MYGWIQYQKHLVRSEVKHQLLNELDESDLVTLTFTIKEASELFWEHEEEFEFEGKMYDVVRTKYDEGNVTYICWPDQKESHLNKLLDQLVTTANQQNQSQNNGNQLLITFFKSLFCSSRDNFNHLNFQTSLSGTPDFIVHYNNIDLDTDTPPPRIILPFS